MKLRLLVGLLLGAMPLSAQNAPSLTGRVPSVPLVTHDPYFSVWLPADKWTGAETVHWTGALQPLTGIVRIDGKAFRFLGRSPYDTPALPQTRNEITPTRTIGTFEGEGVRLKVTFTSPLLPDDLAVMARPVTYVSFETQALDAQTHSLQIGFFVAPNLAVNRPEQPVKAQDAAAGKLDAARVGTVAQPVLQKKGDDLRIDWGYAYLAAPAMTGASHWARDAVKKLVVSGIAAGQVIEIAAPGAPLAFSENGALPLGDTNPHAAAEAPSLAALCNFGEVGTAPVSQHVMLAYDDIHAIQLMNRNLPPFWRRSGADAAKLLQMAENDYAALQRRCVAFDAELTRDAQAVGGAAYARLIALTYRQTLAAHKIVADEQGRALHFSKENFSNGCIATVDVTYPAAPFFLLFSPELLKGQLRPVLDYAASPRWKFPFAPHDLGTYPKANGQVYGGGENTERDQMPVEESGNMLIMLAALAKTEGNAEFAKPYFPQLDKWAAYLKDKGLDPENQLCTDDFAGHLAHNTNLSLKAIVALGSYGVLCEMAGRKDEAQSYRALAQDMAKKWVLMADDGDHYRLAFDKPGTWSQKYNIVWDKLLNLGLFSPEVARKELAFYATKMNTYGLPLDNRRAYSKLDWSVWTATLSSDRSEFEKYINALDAFVTATPERVPLTDWFDTQNARKSGFQARSVVGGVFIKLLDDATLWKKWAARGGKAGPLAPGVKVPVEAAKPVSPDQENAPPPSAPPKTPVNLPAKVVVASAQDDKAIQWRYVTVKPNDGWEKPGFADADWKTGAGGFGVAGTPGAVVGTEWNSEDIWLRRTINVPAPALSGNARQKLVLWMHHDEDADVYLNGVLAVSVKSFTKDYEAFEISKEALAALKPGENLLAIRCHQTGGGQYIDAGLGVAEK